MNLPTPIIAGLMKKVRNGTHPDSSDQLLRSHSRHSGYCKLDYFFPGTLQLLETLRFFVFERTKHQPRRNLRSYLVLQRLCNEAALSPGIDAFLY